MNCYLCGKNNLEVIKDKLRFEVKRNVFKCNDCGLTYLEPKAFSAREFYGTEYRKTHTPNVGEDTSSRQIFETYLPFQQTRLDVLKKILRPDMKVLDIGCATGHFLYALRDQLKRGEFTGIDFNLDNVDFINKELGMKAYSKPVEETGLPEKYFDLITVIQAFEHMEDPIKFLKTVSKYVKPGGYIYVEVPNVDEALLSLYDNKAYADFSFKEAHLFYYSPKTLQAVVEKAGLSGEINSIQRINFLNHLYWIYANGPQKGPNVHMADAVLVSAESADAEAKKDLNNWIKKADSEYRAILNKHQMGESIYFLGESAKK